MPSRRRVLALTAAVVVPAGCTARAPTGETASTAGAVPTLEADERLRARAPTLSVDRDLTLGEHSSYVPANDTVKYPASTSGDDFTFDYTPLSAYVRRNAGAVATRALRDHVESRVSDTTGIDVSMTGKAEVVPALQVAHVTTVDDGEVVAEPAVAAEKLVVVAPRSVDVTVRLEDESYATVFPVYVWRTDSELSLSE